jgi:iron complex outermembrane receptor protein
LLQGFAGFTYSRFRYNGFKSNANDALAPANYDGNKVVGVPDHVYDAGIDVATRWGMYGNTTLEVVGAMPLTFDNGHRAKGYSLLGAKVGCQRELPGRFSLDAFLGMRNITDETWYTFVFLNATGANPNIYLPGPGRTLYGGVNVSKAL